MKDSYSRHMVISITEFTELLEKLHILKDCVVSNFLIALTESLKLAEIHAQCALVLQVRVEQNDRIASKCCSLVRPSCRSFGASTTLISANKFESVLIGIFGASDHCRW